MVLISRSTSSQRFNYTTKMLDFQRLYRYWNLSKRSILNCHMQTCFRWPLQLQSRWMVAKTLLWGFLGIANRCCIHWRWKVSGLLLKRTLKVKCLCTDFSEFHNSNGNFKKFFTSICRWTGCRLHLPICWVVADAHNQLRYFGVYLML